MNSKQLHKHSLPIIILSAGLCLVSVMTLSKIILDAAPAGTSLFQLVTDHQLSIKPAANGLFHVSRYRPGEQADSQATLRSATPGVGAAASTGQTTVLNANLAGQ